MSHLYLPLVFKKSTSRYRALFMCILIFFILLLGSNAQAQNGLKAAYYDGANFDRFVAEKYVENIDEHWNRTPPVAGIDPHSCSIRWTGKLKPEKSGNYKFSARVDDGIRVWIGDRLIIDQWELNDVGVFQSSLDLVANQEYKIRIEYFNALIEGEVRLLWKIPRDELSWYERIFGEDHSHTVIAPKYFFLPDEPDPNKDDAVASINIEETNTSTTEEVKISKPKKEKPVKKKQKNKVALQPTKNKQLEVPKVTVTAKEAEKFIPKNIAFEKSKIVILESSLNELNTFAKFMLDHPKINVVIEGHTDPVGDAKMNLELSKQRAYKVANYLVEKGIDNKRIKAKGFGGSRPLVMPKKGSYHPANRRVVFILSGLE